ncbi:MAG: molybdopterin molybdotransferase MoeA [Clostridiales bacterium]|nr:molybdopterin molybdotransferase MoeA [Clostridiales bacterium]
MLKNIDIERAVEMLCALPVMLDTETVGLADAHGRVFAEDVRAAMMSPPFDRSPFDGYAFRGEDTAGASREHPVTLRITEEIPAGKAAEVEILPGYAAKILTGAPIPKGANATVKYENTEFTPTEVKLFEPVGANTDVIYAGDDIKAGARIAEKGTVITASHQGILAGQGISEVVVYRKPVIKILNTGSELLEVGTPLRPAMIYNSNVYTLSGYLKDMGAEPHNAGIAVDDPDVIAAGISAALRSSDMVITTGGASVGDYDWAVTSASILGADILFWKINMKPGGSMMAAVKDGKMILGLSGNPGAAVLGLFRIARPYIRKLCGRTDLNPYAIDVFLKEPLKKSSPKRRLLRGRLEYSGGKAYFAENEGQGNGTVYSLLGCDLLGEIEAGSPPLPEGTMIKAYRI